MALPDELPDGAADALPPAYLAVVEGLPDMALLYDRTGRLVHANPSGLARLRQLQLMTGDLVDAGVDLTAHVATADRPVLLRALEDAAQGRATQAVRLSLVTGGRTRVGSAVFNPLQLDGTAYVQVVVRDVTARVSAERAIATSEARLRATFEHSPIGLAVVEDGRFTAVNPAMCALLGRSADELVGLRSDDITHPDDRAVNLEVGRTLDAGKVVRLSKRYVRPDLSVVHAELVAVRVHVDGGVHTVVHLRDLTAEREATAQLEHAATHDALTGLGNRLLITDRLDHALARRAEHRRPLAVLFIDLDGFKAVNDALSHSVGDRVLAVVARRLRDAVRPNDSVSRWGGDEFVCILEDLRSDEEALAIVTRIEQAIAAPIEHRSDELLVTASVGVMFSGADDTVSATQLLQGADAAMYRAKALGRGTHSVFDQALSEAAARRGHVEHLLRTAVEDDRVELHYQRLVDLGDRRVVGAEALLRLRDDDGTLLHPAAFLDIAEDTGLILRIEHHVLLLACEQAAAWARAGHDVGVSVNVCATQLSRIDELEKAVVLALELSGLRADRLVCEVTEHALLDTGERTVAGMHRLVERGVEFSVDDFGTGYSSMTYLHELPVAEVKIDRRFVVRAGHDRRAAAIVRAVAGMATELDLRCVAEGIEEPEQHDLALRLGAGVGQGFLYGRPVPAADFLASLDAPGTLTRRV